MPGQDSSGDSLTSRSYFVCVYVCVYVCVCMCGVCLPDDCPEEIVDCKNKCGKRMRRRVVEAHCQGYTLPTALYPPAMNSCVCVCVCVCVIGYADKGRILDILTFFLAVKNALKTVVWICSVSPEAS